MKNGDRLRYNYFGEWEVIFPHPRSSGVRAEKPLTLYMLPRNCFVDASNEVPGPALELSSVCRTHRRPDVRAACQCQSSPGRMPSN